MCGVVLMHNKANILSLKTLFHIQDKGTSFTGRFFSGSEWSVLSSCFERSVLSSYALLYWAKNVLATSIQNSRNCMMPFLGVPHIVWSWRYSSQQLAKATS